MSKNHNTKSMPKYVPTKLPPKDKYSIVQIGKRNKGKGYFTGKRGK